MKTRWQSILLAVVLGTAMLASAVPASADSISPQFLMDILPLGAPLTIHKTVSVEAFHVVPYTSVGLSTDAPAAIAVAFSPAITGVFDRSVTRTFEFDVTLQALTTGVFDFSINALVDGVVTATEGDRITGRAVDSISPSAFNTVLPIGGSVTIRKTVTINAVGEHFGLNPVYNTVTLETDAPAGIGVVLSPSITGVFDRSIARMFDFDVTFTDLASGVFDFSVRALVDGVAVASEADHIVGGNAAAVPEPATMTVTAVGLIGASVLAWRTKRGT